MRAFILNGMEIAKHQNSGQRWTYNAFFIPFRSIVAHQKLLIVGIDRQVIGTALPK